MEPLKVTIQLLSSMVEPGEGFHLDALLGSLKVRQKRHELGDGINPREYHHDLPLERYETGDGEWVFKASTLRLGSSKLFMENWMQTSRLNLSEAARHRESGWLKLRANKPNTAGGPFKTSIGHFPLVWGSLTAYCIGSKEEVVALLSSCRQVGARRGVGWGRVKEISVDSISMDECLWKDRVLPLGADGVEETHSRAIGCLRPPYWDKTLYQEVYVPTI